MWGRVCRERVCGGKEQIVSNCMLKTEVTFMQVATGANMTAVTTLSNARTLNSSAAELRNNVTDTRNTIDELEQEVQEDRVAIATAASSANATIVAVSVLENRITQLQV